MSDVVLDTASALTDGMVTRAVIIYEVLNENGRKGIGYCTSGEMVAWDTLALTEFVRLNVSRKMVVDAEADS